MREEFGDLWELAAHPNSVVCITVNGCLNSRGECVMGRGVALQAKQRYPGLAKQLGQIIRSCGNHTHWLIGTHLNDVYMGTGVVSFPTKHVWWRPSSLELIRQSAEELRELANNRPDLTFYLPRPGCANGGLKWSDVRPVLEAAELPNNVVIVAYPSEQETTQ